MREDSIVLLVAGGHARACIDVLELQGRFRVAGLLGLAPEVGGSVFGYPVLGTEEALLGLLREHANVMVAVGQIKTPEHRIRLFTLARSLGCLLPIIVSPRAHVSRHASLAAGTIVMHGAVVNAGALVGRNCIINTQALIEHGAMIGDHCHIATAAVVNGEARVGEGTFIGSNAVLRERVVVAERSLIGMGEPLRGDWAAEEARRSR